MSIELSNGDFAFVVKRRHDGRAPDVKVWVGDKQIGLISRLTIHADYSKSLTPEIEATFLENIPSDTLSKLKQTNLISSLEEYMKLLLSVNVTVHIPDEVFSDKTNDI